MSIELASPHVPEPGPPHIEIVRSSSDGASVRIVLDMPVGATVQITVEAIPAATRAQGGSAPPVTVKTTLPPEPAPPPVAVPAAITALPPVAAETGAVGTGALAPEEAAAHKIVEGDAAQTLAGEIGPADSRPARTAIVVAPSARLEAASQVGAWRDRLVKEAKAVPLVTTLFALALVIYMVTRLWGIDRFPIFFYSDEASNVLLGQRVLANGWRASDGTWFPIYFEADNNRWTPVLPTYAQALAAQLFGNSVLVARTTYALISLGGAVSVGLLLQLIFKSRSWWASTLLLAIAPAWFLYTRAAFETVVAAACFAAFLLFYLLYRCRSPKFVFAALAFGAAAFYSYSNAQLPVLLMGVVLLIADAKYHLENRTMILRAVPLAAILAWPVVWFRLEHPTAIAQHLQAIDSYWVHDIPLSQKLAQYFTTYLYGLSPQYWVLPNNGESTILPNQHFGGQGHLGPLLFGLALIGLVVALRKFRTSVAHRVVIFAALVTPAGAALDSIDIARVLIFVIPAVLLASLGLDWLLSLPRRVTYPTMAAGVMGVGALLSLAMLRSALVDGPTWSTDYGLYGMQYGTKQIFEDTIPVLLPADPTRQFIVSTGWANNVQLFPELFLPPSQRQQVTLGSVDSYLSGQQPLPNNPVFVMTGPEYGRVQTSAVVTTVEMLKQIYYPNGQPGFYIARLGYTPNAAALLADMAVERRKPEESTINIDGQLVDVFYSRLADGKIENAFDGNDGTFVRGEEANPFVFELHFPQPRTISSLSVKVGATPDFSVTAARSAVAGGPIETVTQRYVDQPPDPQVNIAFGSPVRVSVLRIEIKFNTEGDQAQIHVWEVGLH